MKKRNVHFYTISTEDIPARLAGEYHELLDQFELDGRTFVAVIVCDNLRNIYLLEKLSGNDNYKEVNSRDFDRVVSAVSEIMV